ncbi:hypothetical protein FS842_006511 [Serendipita sp. 407]|nr:hypothetical protein FS842_006511 [Serendipita sp. 407]
MTECVALEHEEPMTSNEGYLAHYKTQFLTSYKAYYKPLILGDRQSSTYMRNVIDNLAKMGITHNETDLLLRLLPTNSSDPTIAEAAISIMAEVRAYYQVAFKR